VEEVPGTFLSPMDMQNQLRSGDWSNPLDNERADVRRAVPPRQTPFTLVIVPPPSRFPRLGVGFRFLGEMLCLPLRAPHLTVLFCRQLCPFSKPGLEGNWEVPVETPRWAKREPYLRKPEDLRQKRRRPVNELPRALTSLHWNFTLSEVP